MAKRFTTRITLPKKQGTSLFSFGKKSKGAPPVSRSQRTRKEAGNKTGKDFSSWSGLKSHTKRISGLNKIGKPGKKGKSVTKKKVLKVLYVIGVAFVVFLFTGTLGVLAYMQSLTKDLPDPEKPFDNDKFKAEASVIYDRNGKELYRLFGKDNRDILRIPKDKEFDDVVTPELKWAFLGAEDINFYEHPGFDVGGVVRCAIRNATSGKTSCGGSTITQQVVKLAALEDNTRSLDRKLRELVLALQLENKINDKDKILLLYMNIAPEGGNVYGVKTGAKYYYNKDISQLTLSEAVTLGAIPNNPSLLSPTRSYNAELGKKSLEGRRNAILDNLLNHKDKINRSVREDREAKAKRENRDLTAEEKEDFITEEKIKAAKEEVLVYKDFGEDIKAPHFVFFARDLLTKRGYNNGEPFTLQEINTGGYKITTTIDLDLQDIALDVVQNVAVKQYGARYGSKNAAQITLVPKTGEILTMVGSKCYNDREMAGCSSLDESEGKNFDPQVNILMSPQQPGSSIKPMVYAEAYKQGILAPGSQMADIPIQIGNYKPVNSDRKYVGIKSARYMLAQSRNIPAVVGVMAIGPERLAEVKKDLGYSFNIDPATYGPSSALGANDVYGVEHANAYGVLANGGKYVPYEAILKIEDKDGNVVWSLEQNKPEAKQVLDEKAAFMVNDSTNPRSITGSDSPVKWRDSRDMGGKTGTSNDNIDNWFINYSPDFVFLGWSGNNGNQPMSDGSFGSTNVEPWIREFAQRVGDSDYFKARTPFTRPGGIGKGQICSKIKVGEQEKEVCEGGSDYYIQGNLPPAYVSKQNAEVCVDQQDRLARDIDKSTGNAVEKEFTYAKMPVSSLQDDLDKYMKEKQGANGIPTEQCDINRSPNGENPWAEITSPITGGNYTGTISVKVKGFSPTGTVSNMKFYIDSTEIGSTSQANFDSTLNIPSGVLTGTHAFKVVVTDSNSKTGTASVNINITGVNPGLKIDSPTGPTEPSGNINVNASSDVSLNGVHLFMQKDAGAVVDLGVMAGGGTNYNLNWNVAEPGVYKIWVRSIDGSYRSESSAVVTLTVV